jgi:iron(III) transport system ATP-binding protein
LPLLQLQHITKRLGGFELQDISFEMRAGEVLALLGESGSGKSSLLRLIAGLDKPDAGRMVLDEQLLAGPGTWVKPQRRPISLAFQETALFPNLSIQQNVAFGLKGWPKGPREARSQQLLELTGLSDRAQHRPDTLSGGEQQRVALARALAPEPRLLLLDEPFSRLDTARREQLRREVFELLQTTHTPTILVTHDVQDVYALADRVIVLQQGRILQEGTPQNIYQSPHDGYVARLFGPANIFPASDLWPFFPQLTGQERNLCIRPEQLQIGEEGLPVRLLKRRFQGEKELWEVQSDLGPWLIWGHGSSPPPEAFHLQLKGWRNIM